MNEWEQILVQTGSVAATAAQIGEQAASEAMYSLTLRAPEELQQSWPMVLQWARFQHAYEIAESLGDVKGMLAASQASANLVKDLY